MSSGPPPHAAVLAALRSRRRRTKRAPMVRKIARQEARKVVNKSIETKHFFGRTAGYINTDYNGLTINMLTNPATGVDLIQGTDNDQYVGDTFKPVFIGLKYQCEAVPAAGQFSTWTIMVLQVKGGGIPLPVNVLQSVGNNQTPFSFIDPTYADTFRVLARRTISAQPTTSQGTLTKHGYIKIPSRRMRKVNMHAPTFTPAAYGIFVVIYGDSAIPANPVQLTWDIAFKDA